jgi:hypothetical protein
MKMIKIIEDIQQDNALMEEIQQKCKISWDQYINKNKRLYRGIRGTLDNKVMKLEAMERNAKDWSNIPNVLFDKQNEGIAQKRTKCVIFTSSEYEAKSYGKAHNLFIPDDAKISFQPEGSDNNCSYKNSMVKLFGRPFSLESFDELIQSMLSKVTPYRNERSIITTERDYEDIMNVLRLIHKHTKENELDMDDPQTGFTEYTTIYNTFRKLSDEEFERKLLELFDATANQIETTTTEQLYSIFPNNTEFWTESTCYAVDRDFMAEWKASQNNREDDAELLKKLGANDQFEQI